MYKTIVSVPLVHFHGAGFILIRRANFVSLLKFCRLGSVRTIIIFLFNCVIIIVFV